MGWALSPWCGSVERWQQFEELGSHEKQFGANTLGKVNVVFVASLLTPVRVSCYEKDEPGAGGIVQ